MILIIDNYDSFTYNLYQSIAQFHKNVRVIRNDCITVDEVIQLKPAGIILSPGPGRPESAGICIDLIQALTSKTIPLLGVCLGLQAIVTALGGDIIQAPEIVHGKPELIFHDNHGIYQNMPQPFQAGRYHSLMAKRATLPETLHIDAENKAGLIMGVRHQTLPIFGVQYHPESILTPEGNILLKNFVEQYVDM